jgi:hypothetical protein
VSGIVQWEAPPPRRGGRVHDWDAIAKELRARPGEWALVAVCTNQTTAASTARYIRDGKYKPMSAGFDATSRTVDGEARVYARYTGKGS